MHFTKKDLFFSVITGFYTGLIAWRIFVFLGLPVITFWDRANCYMNYIPGGPEPMRYCTPDYLIVLPTWWFVFIVPVLWILGVNLGYFLGRWMPFFNQFGKYAAIGFTNAAVDFGVLNLLIAWSGVASGLLYGMFKAISFVLAATHSYGWNKYWAFSAEGGSASGGQFIQKQEFFKFFIVNIIAAIINVGVATFVVNGIDPILNLNQNTWANIGAVVGSAVALIFNFIGLKVIVFKEIKNVNIKM